MKRIYTLVGAELLGSMTLYNSQKCYWCPDAVSIVLADGRQFFIEDLLKFFVVYWEGHIETPIFNRDCRWLGPYKDQNKAREVVKTLENACEYESEVL